MTRMRDHRHPLLGLLVLGAGALPLGGCNVDSWFNPSVTGYWEHQPTSIPILTRLDAIENGDDGWGQTTSVSPEDLIPNDLTYRLAPGDVVLVNVLDLYAVGAWATTTTRVDPGGFIRVPEVGDVQAAGRTLQELQDGIRSLYEASGIRQPQVDIALEAGGGFKYAIDGFVANTGVWTLNEPDLRLNEAVALAGGIPSSCKRIFVIRRVELSEAVKPGFERDRGAMPPSGAAPEGGVDIDDLIDRLDKGGDRISPGVLRQDGEPQIDIDDLEPVGTGAPAREGIDQVGSRRAPVDAGGSGSWVYIEERGEWVRVPGGRETSTPGDATGEPPLYVERIIEIPVDPLRKGQSKFDIVVRPDDRIYLETPPQGFVYIDGQISRPGPYEIPLNSEFTLSRLVAAAGGLNQVAIPERVDLVRIVGENREAVIRVNLGAIRHKTEPDILLKPDDHINIGTNFWATPLAVVRNGFRATYGFGFLLDRNFGNDVFGPPPVNRFGE